MSNKTRKPSASAADAKHLLMLLRAGRYAELTGAARAYLAGKPGDGRAWHMLGHACLAQGQLRDARPALERAAALEPNRAEVWSDLATCLSALGEREAAAGCFERSLKCDPGRAEVWANAGRNALDAGQHAQAEALLRQALSLQPGMAAAQYNLAAALKAQGRADEALAAYRKVLQLAPQSAEAHSAVALGFLELGQAEAALAASRRALTLKPGLVEASVNLGSALAALRRYEEAEAAYRQALAARPGLAEAHNNLGIVLWEMGRTEEAVAAYRQALQFHPHFAEAQCNLGNALQDLGELDAALAAYRRALELAPGFVDAHYGVINTFEKLKRFDEALAACGKALESFPVLSAELQLKLGNVLESAGRRKEAVDAFRHAIELRPEFVEAYSNLSQCLARMGRFDEAAGVARAGVKFSPGDIGIQSGLLFVLNYLEGISPAVMLAEARAYGERMAARAVPFAQHGNSPEPERRLRVGLVSGDFGDHPVGHFLEGMLSHLDSAGIELFAYETFKRKGELNRRLRRLVPNWRNASAGQMPDEALAGSIREDGIDILIDLAGHTAHNRLPVFAWKPAPVQVTWLGYLGTTGLAAMDYILADPRALPSGEEDQFVETPWRLPESYICFTAPTVAVEPGPLPALENGCITFGSFNNLAKVSDSVVAAWARVLQAVPASRLFLKAGSLESPDVREALLDRFAVHGIGAEHLRMEGGFSSREAHFSAYHQVDIALDPFPYPGITTSVESLWMGVPVLTLRGNRFLGHQGETILHNAGLADWVAESEGDYVVKAAAFARDPQHLAELRARLRGQVLASPLFDAPRFAKNFEAALRGMWRKWCEEKRA